MEISEGSRLDTKKLKQEDRLTCWDTGYVSAQNTLLAEELRELTGLGAWEGGSLPCRTANRSSISCVDGTGPRQSSFRAASLASISA